MSKPPNGNAIATLHGPGSEQAALSWVVADVIVECQAIRNGAPSVGAFAAAGTLNNRFGRSHEQAQVPYVSCRAEALRWCRRASVPHRRRDYTCGPGYRYD